MPQLGRSEYYPWFEDSSATLPKDRYLNREFLRSEQRRIAQAWEWHEEYRKAERGDKLDEYITYIIPIEISKLLKREVNGRGYTIIGTSALRNNLQLELLALFPAGMVLPPDYSLIRIEEPIKETIPFPGDIYGADAIVIQDWEPLPVDHIYSGLESETVDVFKVLENHLGGDELMAHSVHAPMISSPPTATETGGIGSCSLTPTSRFAETLNTQIARMLPPEYTDYGPPKKDFSGYNERHSKGRGKKIIYKTAEKIPGAQSRVGLETGDSYRNIQKEAQIRAGFEGEYSYMGNVVPREGRAHHVVQDALGNFTQNEITISSYDVLKESDVDLTRLQNNIRDYEDIWITMVDARQVMPDISEQRLNQDKWIADLQKDWTHFLPQMGYTDVPHQVSELRANQTFKNILRLAQQFARGERREQIYEKDMENARWNFKVQAERLLDSDVVKDAARQIERSHTTDRESLVQTFLQSKPCTRNELITNLLDTRQFDNEKKTKKFVQRMIERGYIFRSTDGKLRSA